MLLTKTTYQVTQQLIVDTFFIKHWHSWLNAPRAMIFLTMKWNSLMGWCYICQFTFLRTHITLMIYQTYQKVHQWLVVTILVPLSTCCDLFEVPILKIIIHVIGFLISYKDCLFNPIRTGFFTAYVGPKKKKRVYILCFQKPKQFHVITFWGKEKHLT